MEEKITFQSEVSYDLATYKEFTRINTYTISRTTICGIVYVLCMFYLLSALEYGYTAKTVLAVSLFSLGFHVYHWLRSRDGGIEYKRMLRSHGHIPRYQVSFGESGFIFRNIDSEKEISCSYGDMRCMKESKRLLILVDDLKTAHILDKTLLTGGSPEELVSFLRAKCPKLKRRIQKGRLGRCVWYLMRIVPVIMLLAALLVLLHIPAKLRGQFTNNTPARQMAEELAELDIHISAQALDTMLLWESDDTSYFPRYYGASKAYDLMSFEGMGQYDEAGVWTPSESGLYWFDMEVMYVDTMYSDFLRGVDAMDEVLAFTNVREDYTHADPETGTGRITVTFDYLGQSYLLNARYNYDWFDTEILYELGKILKSDHDPKSLWYTTSGQDILLYYGTVDQCDALENKTGLIFLDPVENRFYA